MIKCVESPKEQSLEISGNVAQVCVELETILRMFREKIGDDILDEVIKNSRKSEKEIDKEYVEKIKNMSPEEKEGFESILKKMFESFDKGDK